MDAIACTVSVTTPLNLAAGVAHSANVTATFSEAIRVSTLNKTTVKVVKNGTITAVGAKLSYDAVAKKVILTPTST